MGHRNDWETGAPTSHRLCDFLLPLGLSFPIWHFDSDSTWKSVQPPRGSPRRKLGPSQTSPAPLALKWDSSARGPAASHLKLASALTQNETSHLQTLLICPAQSSGGLVEGHWSPLRERFFRSQAKGALSEGHGISRGTNRS